MQSSRLSFPNSLSHTHTHTHHILVFATLSTHNLLKANITLSCLGYLSFPFRQRIDISVKHLATSEL